MSETNEIHKDLNNKRSNYYDESELERYTVVRGLFKLSEMLSKSETQENVAMGAYLLNMSNDIMKTLPDMSGGVNINVELTNKSVDESDLDNIIDNFFKD